MEQAKKMVLRSPKPGMSRAASPIDLPETHGDTLMGLLKDFTDETGGNLSPTPSEGNMLSVLGAGRSPSPGLSILAKQMGAKSPTPQTSKSPIPKSPIPKKDDSLLKAASPPPIISPPQIASPPLIVTPPPSLTPSPITSPPKTPDIPTICSPTGNSYGLVNSFAATIRFLGEERPLIPMKRQPGDSPPKVIKRKAPAPDTAAAISRPTVSEPPAVVPGTIPPPPPKIKSRPPTPPEPVC